MDVQFAHAPVHTPETVREIVREAEQIANETELDGRAWEAVFAKACDLLGERASAAIPVQHVPVELASLRTGSR